MLRYEKSISDDPAFLISKVQPCPTSSEPTLSVVNGFSDQGELEAMKTLSGWEAARCGEHPFRAKIKVSA